MSERPKLNLFDIPAQCVSPALCGSGGRWPDRCATCGHCSPAQAPSANLTAYKAGVEAQLKRMEQVLGGTQETQK
jgi:hypothetical protein